MQRGKAEYGPQTAGPSAQNRSLLSGKNRLNTLTKASGVDSNHR